MRETETGRQIDRQRERENESHEMETNLLDDEVRVHDVDGHRGVRDGAECRRVELGDAAPRDRSQTELLHDRRAAAAGIAARGIATAVSCTGHLSLRANFLVPRVSGKFLSAKQSLLHNKWSLTLTARL